MKAPTRTDPPALVRTTLRENGMPYHGVNRFCVWLVTSAIDEPHTLISGEGD
jgi:hypothetical protein